jgi:hypothetical protein
MNDSVIKMNTDSFFQMGSTHKVCEDYAASSHSDLYKSRIAFTAIGDGCSICLGPDNEHIQAHTDFGSRLMVRSAADILGQRHMDLSYIHHAILQQAYNWAYALKFPRHTLSSTLLLGQYLEGKMVATVAGDGVFAARHRGSKIWEIIELDMLTKDGETGPPYYLRYELKKGDRDLFLSNFGGVQATSHLLNLEKPESTKTVTWVLDDVPSPTDPYTPQPFFVRWDFDVENYDMLAMFSDGVQTFADTSPEHNTPKAIPVVEVLQEFLNIKGENGEFVRRRCNKAMKKFVKAGITHSDDFSMTILKVDNA